MKSSFPLILFIFIILTLPLHASEQRTIKLTLSPETTYLMEPQLPDGRIDYLAALNQRLAAQTTPENNLLVGVFSIIAGETEEALLRERTTEEERKGFEMLQKYRERFCNMLGTDPPSLDSLVVSSPMASTTDYKKELLKFYSKEKLAPMIEKQREHDKNHYQRRFDEGKMTKEEYDAQVKKIETEIPDWYYRGIVSDQWDETRKRPWTTQEFPYLAKWIATTDLWTPKLIDISRRRTGYFHPLLSYENNSSLTYHAVLPYAQSFRSAARFFQMRGNWDFTHGRFNQATECAFSSVRTGRTIRSGAGSIVEDLVGISIIGSGNHQLATYLTNFPGAKDATWILQKKKEYDSIEREFPLPWQPKWCSLERFGTLSAVQTLAVEPETAHEFFKTGVDDEDFLAKYEKLFKRGTEYDWNEILKQINFFYDDMEDVYLISSWQRRLRAATRLEQRIGEYHKRSIESSDLQERKAIDFLLGNLMPSIESVMYALARIEWDIRITSVAFAVAAYRAEHGGESPDTLEQLVPKYLEKIPDSPFTDKPLRYIKRQRDVLIANDDEYKLDGSEEEIEKRIAEAEPGGRVFPTARHFVFVVTKK